MGFGDVVVKDVTRNEGDEGGDGEKSPGEGFGNVMGRGEGVIGKENEEEVDGEHVEESPGVDSGREEGWNAESRKGSGEEGNVHAEVGEKAYGYSIYSSSVVSPVPIYLC